MREKRFNNKPACSVKSSPFPMEVTCPHCGNESELWSDEKETSCKLCGYSVLANECQVN